MKTQIKKMAAAWRQQHGNECKAYKIKQVSRLAGVNTEQIKTEQIKQEIVRQSKLSDARARARAEHITVKQVIKQRITDTLTRIARNMPDDALSMGSTYKVYLSAYAEGKDDRTREYSRSCKYGAHHNMHAITITPTEYMQIKSTSPLCLSGQEIAPNVFSGKVLIATGKKQHYYARMEDRFFAITADGARVYESETDIANAVEKRISLL